MTCFPMLSRFVSPKARSTTLGPAFLAAAWGITSFASAQSVQEPTSDPSPEAELASFQLHEGFEINLFADESLGIANPIAIH